MSESGARKKTQGRLSEKPGVKPEKGTRHRRNSQAPPPPVTGKRETNQGTELIIYSRKVLSLLAKEKEICQGIFYFVDRSAKTPVLRILSAYAYDTTETEKRVFDIGEGFPGQVAKDGALINIFDVPDGYITIVSGLGSSDPSSLILFPVIHDEKVLAVIELASFHRFTEDDEAFFTRFAGSVAEKMAGMIHNV